jgi:hypothetical protein
MKKEKSGYLPSDEAHDEDREGNDELQANGVLGLEEGVGTLTDILIHLPEHSHLSFCCRLPSLERGAVRGVIDEDVVQTRLFNHLEIISGPKESQEAAPNDEVSWVSCHENILGSRSDFLRGSSGYGVMHLCRVFD